jgi:hypothetical protein
MTLLGTLELQATAVGGAVGRYAKEAVRERMPGQTATGAKAGKLELICLLGS